MSWRVCTDCARIAVDRLDVKMGSLAVSHGKVGTTAHQESEQIAVSLLLPRMSAALGSISAPGSIGSVGVMASLPNATRRWCTTRTRTVARTTAGQGGGLGVDWASSAVTTDFKDMVYPSLFESNMLFLNCCLCCV